MFKIENLGKIYSSTKKIKTVALKDINLVLPNKGFVIVLGKSGSGKSTLLNLLSTLDNKTSGKIYFNNLDYDVLNSEEKTVLTNKEFGFAFQRDALIKEFTVYDNLRLVIDILGKDISLEELKKFLEEFDLHENYLKKYPSELSAGERARVALLRALIKKPKVLFTDEPTGNVDHRTALLVLNILEKYSKEMLIIMVTHNQDDAYKYADRLIFLQDGEVIKDLTKNRKTKNDFYIDKYGNLYLPYAKPLNDTELFLLNNKKPNARIYQNNYDYYKRNLNNAEIQYIDIKDIKTHNLFKYASKLFFKRSFFVVLMSFIVAFLLVVGNISYNLSNYTCDQSRENYAAILNEEPVYAKRKVIDDITETITSLEEIDENLITEIENQYEGKVYKMYPITLFSYGTTTRKSGSFSCLKEPYICNQTNGTLVCDIDYLMNKFGENGELKIAAGEIKEDSPGVIITDYLADSLKYSSPNGSFLPTTYGEILNYDFPFNLKIDAIIETNYEEKFKDELATIGPNVTAYATHAMLYDELFDYYSVLFSINPNFINDYIDSALNSEHRIFDAYFNKNVVSTLDKSANCDFVELRISFEDSLNKGETIINLDLYNKLMGTEFFSLDDIKKEDYQILNINVDCYTSYFSDTPKISLNDLRIKTLFPFNKTMKIFVSKEDFKDILLASYVPVRIYFNGPKLRSNLRSFLEKEGLSEYFLIDIVYLNVEEVVLIFTDIFKTLVVVMIILSLVFVILVVTLILRKDKGNIGIFRSLGLQIKDINKLYTLTFLSVLVFGIFFLFIGTQLGNMLCNSLLVNGFELYLDYGTLYGLTFLNFNPISTIILGIILIAFVLISLIIPYFVIKKNRPIDILRNNE